MAIKLIVGLGNPGLEYAMTRHNAGVWFIEAVLQKYRVDLSPQSKFFGLVGQVLINSHPIRLLVPATYMNRSGQSVAALVNFYRIEPADILVVHDELDLPCGIARLKQGGGHGGHNGLRDIIAALGNQKDFARLRVGIDHPGHKSKVTDFVLNKPLAAQRQSIDDAINKAVQVLPKLVGGDWQAAQQELHTSLV